MKSVNTNLFEKAGIILKQEENQIGILAINGTEALFQFQSNNTWFQIIFNSTINQGERLEVGRLHAMEDGINYPDGMREEKGVRTEDHYVSITDDDETFLLTLMEEN